MNRRTQEQLTKLILELFSKLELYREGFFKNPKNERIIENFIQIMELVCNPEAYLARENIKVNFPGTAHDIEILLQEIWRLITSQGLKNFTTHITDWQYHQTCIEIYSNFIVVFGLDTGEWFEPNQQIVIFNEFSGSGNSDWALTKGFSQS